MQKPVSSYVNQKGETILVYPNGFKIRQSLAAAHQAAHAQERAERKADARRRWVEWCKRNGENPDD